MAASHTHRAFSDCHMSMGRDKTPTLDMLSGFAGSWGVRTRATTVNSGGKLEWTERLILELSGPTGAVCRLLPASIFS